MSIKTCKLQTCDEKHEVELKDMMVYDLSNEIIQTVSGVKILHLKQNFAQIDSKISSIETLLRIKNSEQPYVKIENEMDAIRDLINQIHKENLKIELLASKVSSGGEQVLTNIEDFKKEFESFKKDYVTTKAIILKSLEESNKKIQNFKNELDETKKDIDDKFEKKSNELDKKAKENRDNLKKDLDKVESDLTKKVQSVQLDPDTELQTGGMTFKNKAGKTTIRFNSSVNHGSDYGYIQYLDDKNEYGFWGDSGENSALVIGVENDGQRSTSDVVVLKSKAAVIIDAPDLFLKEGSNIKQVGGLGTPDYSSGWFNVDRNGKEINNPLGCNAFFIGYQRFGSGTYMQFGVFSSYTDDDRRDGDSGMYLIIEDKKLKVSTYKKSNNKSGYIAGLSDGISHGLSMKSSIDVKILGWKIPGGVK